MVLTPLLLSLAAPLMAQTVGGSDEVLYTWSGVGFGDDFGNDVANAGDLNNDGIDDMLVGAPLMDDPGGPSTTGAAFAYSGADGSLLHTWYGEANSDFFGGAIDGAGDVNNDGYDDVIIGAWTAYDGPIPTTGAAYVYSGFDGALLYKWLGSDEDNYFGWSVAGIGDVDGDGHSDVAVGAWKNDTMDIYAGAVYLYSGATGLVLNTWFGTEYQEHFGQGVGAAGDVDNDGTPDIIIGAPGYSGSPSDNFGRTRVYSGATFLQIHEWVGTNTYDFHGYTVTGAGDVDGDSHDDLLVCMNTAGAGGADNLGDAFLYSGATGAVIHHWRGTTNFGGFGQAIDSAGDFNGDGTLDIVIGEPVADTAYVYSGVDGSLLKSWSGDAGDGLGNGVAGLPDLNADGRSEILLGEIDYEPAGLFNTGGAHVRTYNPFLEGSLTEVSASAGDTLDLNFSFPLAAAGHDYITLMSISGTGPVFYGTDIPLTVDSFLLDSAGGIYPFTVTSNLHGTLDGAAKGAASITFPAGAFNFAVGYSFHLATVAFPSGSLPAFSSVAHTVTFTP